MPFCPVCKNEYRPGFTECHECKVPLVDSLEEVTTEHTAEVSMKPKKFFDVNDERSYEFLDKYKEEEEEEQESEIVSYDEITFKERPVDADESEDDLTVMPSVSEQMMRQRMIAEAMHNQNVYVDKKQKISDYKSSGYVLLFVGGIGILALILLYTGVIPGFSGFKSNYMLMGVMLFLFIVFIISGILSFAQIKSITLEAEADDDATKRVKEFMDGHLTAEKIAKDVVIGKSDTEEEMYFKRTEYMTRILLQNFPDLESSLMEKLIDERYTEMYEDNDH